MSHYHSAYYGGGIVNYATLTITSSTISGNSGGYGGGIYSTTRTLTVTDSTVSGNGAYLGGGIAASAGTLDLSNSIVAINFDSAGFPDIRGSVSSGSNNIVGGNPGLELENGKPKLADNGGPTETIALLANSPALDAANRTSCPATDQRGVTRPQGSGCDIGAFELESADTTPPTITPTVTGTLGSNGWYTSDVTVSWTVTDDESAVSSQTGCDSATINTDTTGVALTCEASSAGGTASEKVTLKRDATAPRLAPSVSPNPVLLNGSATATPNASDALSGIASQRCETVVTSSVGSKSVSCTATDNAGNTAMASLNYTVTYTFSGFSAPVDNLPTLNKAKAGQAVPLKWRLTDANGAPVTNLASVQVSVVGLGCSSGATPDAIEEYAAGSSGLQNLGNGYYQFNWKTPKTYANSCKTLQLDMGEGSYRTAAFQFTK